MRNGAACGGDGVDRLEVCATGLPRIGYFFPRLEIEFDCGGEPEPPVLCVEAAIPVGFEHRAIAVGVVGEGGREAIMMVGNRLNGEMFLGISSGGRVCSDRGARFLGGLLHPAVHGPTT